MNTPSTASAGKASIRRRVFIVDDHPFVLEWLKNFIDQQEDLCVCGQAADPRAALSEIVRLNPDIAVIDLSLRGKSGLELIKQVRALTPRPNVLVLSMHEEAYYAERALRAGALGYVMKREITGKIIEAVRQVLQGQFYVSESLAKLIAQKSVGRAPMPSASSVEHLTDRELEVFCLIGHGHENRRIAEELHLSLKTVQAHCEHIKEKLALENATALIREAVRWVETEKQG